MYPGMIFWWNQTRRPRQEAVYASCGGGYASSEPGPSASRSDSRLEAASDGCSDYGAGFGVRRPLRFLAYKLQLSETQVGELARVLNELKTERAQADVDDRRAMAAFADALSGASFEQERAGQAVKQRSESHQRLQDAVVKALGRIHALLKEDQRATLAYLIRTGTLTL